MKFFKTTNGFAALTDSELVTRSNYIVTAMTGNPHFTTPTPELADVIAAINGFENALEVALQGNRNDIALKNQRRNELITILHLLSNYVLFTAQNNEVIAKSSGFTISRIPQPAPAIVAPENLQLKSGANKGELQLKFKKVAGARAYMYEITPGPVTPESKWVSLLDTVAKQTFTGLQSGTEYYCRVAAIGIKRQVVYSGTVSRVAL